MTQDVKIYANMLDEEERRVAVVEDGRLRDLYVEHGRPVQQSGDIYLARVESIVSGMNAAFLNLGDGRNGFLYLADAKGFSVHENGELIVQVTKTPRRSKGARVTPQVSLPGRFFVYLPFAGSVGVSRKIGSAKDRQRLRALVGSVERGGVIIRTAAQDAADEDLAADLAQLQEQWERIEQSAKLRMSPGVLWQEDGFLIRALRDELAHHISEVVTDSREAFDAVKGFVSAAGAGWSGQVSLLEKGIDLFEYCGLTQEIESLIRPKVWLPSGGYLVIDQTEALTAIDVNSGKCVDGSSLSAIVKTTNLEAAREIARQIRLRAIGGIVIVDFIDMESEADRTAVLDALKDASAADPNKVRVYGMTSLGLAEVTRKRTRLDLRSQMTQPCSSCCEGRTWKDEALAASVKRRLRKAFAGSSSGWALVAMNDELAQIVAQKWLKGWEETFGRRIVLRGLPGASRTDWRIEALGDSRKILTQAQSPWEREEPSRVYRTTDS